MLSLHGGSGTLIARDGAVSLTLGGRVILHQSAPAGIEIWRGRTRQPIQSAYSHLEQIAEAIHARATIAGVEISDIWTLRDGVVHVRRSAVVKQTTPDAGFVSAVTFQLAPEIARAWPAIRPFAPGVLYGDSADVTATAIGGTDSYTPGDYHCRIREDRLPAPLLGLLAGEVSAAILNPAPSGDTVTADSLDTSAELTLIDPRLRFAALGIAEDAKGLSIGGYYPGTEGQITYRGDTYPGGQLRRWRVRLHPLVEGFSHSFELAFHISAGGSFQTFRDESWRWAWRNLCPQVSPQPIDLIRRACIDVLLENVQTINGKTGFNIYVNAVNAHVDDSAQYMGFVGRCTDAAENLLREAERRPDGASLRQAAVAVLDDFATLAMDPPQAEGFKNGLPHTYPFMGIADVLYLRSLCEGARAVLHADQRDAASERGHPNWRAWVNSFAAWLLRQQRSDGSFPRAFRAGSGEVVHESPKSTSVAIRFLLDYGNAGIRGDAALCPGVSEAIRAGEFCWVSGHGDGRFVGGTIDNPDVLDKEAGTIAMDAYLALFEATGERKWLDRAEAAGRFAETWIYLWNVPMPIDANPADLHWKPGVSTVGAQLIATGHSLVDQYMAFDAGSYRKLFNHTGDTHYRDIADILLHNTKGMMGLPDRPFDLAGPGWQQEHWSLAPRRGIGLHRGWLPWIAVSHLHGIIDCEEMNLRAKHR